MLSFGAVVVAEAVVRRTTDRDVPSSNPAAAGSWFFVSFALSTIPLVVPKNSIVAKSYHAEKLCNFFIVIMTVFKSAKSFS